MPQIESRTKLPVAILGATGSVGQRFVTMLANHPWFEVAALMASERSAGKTYRDAVRWVQTAQIPEAMADMPVTRCEPSKTPPLVFSALDSSVAGPLETDFARAGACVVSNAKNHRMDPDVPLVVPEVNPDHVALIEGQSFGAGSILTNPNCSTIGLVLALKPLADAFGLEQVHVVTMQAVSGAGIPGLSSYEILDNVIPFISGEEEKMESETRKILGTLRTDGIDQAPVIVSAQCNRVPVIDGHTECVSVKLSRAVSADELLEAWRSFMPEPQQRALPSAPQRPIHVILDPAGPQPRLHRDLDGGMATAVGRLRPCPLMDYKFVTLSHNTVRGAAGGALLVAELAHARGLVVRTADAGRVQPALPR